MKKCLILGAGLAAIVSLAACSPMSYRNANTNSPVPAAASATQLKQFKGVSIDQVGETVRVVMPNALLFYPNSSVMKHAKVDIVTVLKQYMNKNKLISADIATFSPIYPASRRQQRLATQRSQSLMNTLVYKGIDIRLLTAQGDLRMAHGRRKLVFSPTSYSGITVIYFKTQANHWAQ